MMWPTFLDIGWDFVFLSFKVKVLKLPLITFMWCSAQKKQQQQAYPWVEWLLLIICLAYNKIYELNIFFH